MKMLRTLTYILAALLAVAGSFAIAVSPDSPRFASSPAQPVIVGCLFIAWSLFLVWYQSRSYRGGVATIIGSFLLGFAVFIAADDLIAHPEQRVASDEVAFLLVLFLGVTLLIVGHRRHSQISHSK